MEITVQRARDLVKKMRTQNYYKRWGQEMPPSFVVQR